MKKYIQSYWFLFVVSGGIIALDQWTKFLIRTNLTIGEIWSPWEWLTPYARVVRWYNTGVAFGLFQDANTVFAILAIIVSLAIIFYFPRVPLNEWTLRLALSMQLAGAVGNLIDRLTVKHVIDFISVGSFPVFNIADSSITVGVGVLLFGIWMQDRKEKLSQITEVMSETPEEPVSQ